MASNPSPAFRVEVVEATPALTKLLIAGVIDEHADLDIFQELKSASVRIDLQQIRRINSFGVRAWMRAISTISEDIELIFERCPPPVVDQCNMVSGFLGHGVIETFYAPMICELCDEQMDKIFDAQECRSLGGNLPETKCPSCGEDMEIDDLEEQYLLFLRDS